MKILPEMALKRWMKQNVLNRWAKAHGLENKVEDLAGDDNDEMEDVHFQDDEHATQVEG